MRATGMPDWIVSIGGLAGRPHVGEGQCRPRSTPGCPELQRHLDDDAERAFGADKEPREIIARGGFLGRVARCG